MGVRMQGGATAGCVRLGGGQPAGGEGEGGEVAWAAAGQCSVFTISLFFLLAP